MNNQRRKELYVAVSQRESFIKEIENDAEKYN